MAATEYRASPTVGSEELNLLFNEAWPERTRTVDFEPVLNRSLGWICAYQADELVGFVNVAWDGGVHAFLLDPVVRTDRRRQGIGRELVRHAVQLARDREAEWLHVDFVPGLEPFYRACGFRESKAGLIRLTSS